METAELRSFRWYGEKKKGTMNRFYEISADEREDGRGVWTFKWGRIGTAGRVESGIVHSYSRAVDVCKAKIAAKSSYREVSPLEALASCCEELHERPNRGLSAVEIDVPNWHAGASNGRLNKFAAKYLERLNVIRASFNDLSYGDYDKQIETMLKQYIAEFARIVATKGHGKNVTQHSETSARIFFGALRDNAGMNTYIFYPSRSLF